MDITKYYVYSKIIACEVVQVFNDKLFSCVRVDISIVLLLYDERNYHEFILVMLEKIIAIFHLDEPIVDSIEPPQTILCYIA